MTGARRERWSLGMTHVLKQLADSFVFELVEYKANSGHQGGKGFAGCYAASFQSDPKVGDQLSLVAGDERVVLNLLFRARIHL